MTAAIITTKMYNYCIAFQLQFTRFLTINCIRTSLTELNVYQQHILARGIAAKLLVLSPNIILYTALIFVQIIRHSTLGTIDFFWVD